MLDNGREAGIDTSRVALGTVPGTVHGVVGEGMSDRTCRAIATATCFVMWSARLRASCRDTCGFTGRLILAVTCRTTPMCTAATTQRAVRRGTLEATCGVTLKANRQRTICGGPAET